MFVEPKDPACTDRLDVANPLMMSDLKHIGEELIVGAALTSNGDPLPFRLISRRMQQVLNSSGRALQRLRGRRYNPAFMHPDDLAELGLQSGSLAEIRSARVAITAVMEPDETLRRGLVSMTHAFGALPGQDDVRRTGTNTGRLLDIRTELQPYTDQPQMSNVPVSVIAVDDDRRVLAEGS